MNWFGEANGVKVRGADDAESPCETHLRKKLGQILLDNLVKTSRKPRRYYKNIEGGAFWKSEGAKEGRGIKANFPVKCIYAKNMSEMDAEILWKHTENVGDIQ